MLTRVCLIAAIVFSVAVATLNLWKVREIIDTTRTTLNVTSNNLYTTTITLNETRQELDDTKDDLARTQQNLETTTAERDQLKSANASLTKDNNGLRELLKKTTQERDDAQAELAAWEALGIPVDQVKVIIKTAKETEEMLQVAKEENKILDTEVRKLKNQLSLLVDQEYKVPLPPSLQGKVLVADPKWDFVVLNVGEADGVLEQGELLVNRDGRLVAKVRVQSVQMNRSIANMVEGWKLGDVAEGDLVIPAL